MTCRSQGLPSLLVLPLSHPSLFLPLRLSWFTGYLTTLQSYMCTAYSVCLSVLTFIYESVCLSVWCAVMDKEQK